MSELVVLAGESETKIKYGGKEFVITALKVSDIADLEAKFDLSLEDLFKDKKHMMDKMTFVLWLSMRRNGLSSEQIKAKAWALQPEDVSELFDIEAATKALEIVLKLSGMEVKIEKTGPNA